MLFLCGYVRDLPDFTLGLLALGFFFGLPSSSDEDRWYISLVTCCLGIEKKGAMCSDVLRWCCIGNEWSAIRGLIMEHQRGVGSCIDINVSEVDRFEINPETLDMLMTINEHVARLATLICISRVVDI
jgi:hypothetical protein